MESFLSWESQMSMQQYLGQQYKLGSFVGRNMSTDASWNFEYDIKDTSLPSTGASTPLTEWSHKKEDGDLSLETSSGSATPPDWEAMLNLIETQGLVKNATMSTNHLGRNQSLRSLVNLMPPPGLPAPESGLVVGREYGLDVPPGLPAPESSFVVGREYGLAQAPPVPDVHTSIGTFGHPDRCAGSCRYIKRKGGCRNGASCPQCHLCFWQRKTGGEAKTQKAKPPHTQDLNCVAAFSGQDSSISDFGKNAGDDEVSRGSENHPHGCATACKYVNKKGGCREGEACLDCHLCPWRRSPPRAMPLKVGLVEKSALGHEPKDRLEWLIKLQLDAVSQEVSA
jgi:hypothetical protein